MNKCGHERPQWYLVALVVVFGVLSVISVKCNSDAEAAQERESWTSLKAAFSRDAVAAKIDSLLAEFEDVQADSSWVVEEETPKGTLLKSWCKRVGPYVLCVRVVHEPEIAADPWWGEAPDLDGPHNGPRP